MTNADIPKLLRAMAGGSQARSTGQDVMLNIAANELDARRTVNSPMDDGYRHALALYDRASVSDGEKWIVLAGALLAIWPRLAHEKIDRPRYDDHSEMCKGCFGLQQRHVDRKTGRYHVMLPSNCPHKGKCEGDLLKNYSGRKDGHGHQAPDRLLPDHQGPAIHQLVRRSLRRA